MSRKRPLEAISSASADDCEIAKRPSISPSLRCNVPLDDVVAAGVKRQLAGVTGAAFETLNGRFARLPLRHGRFTLSLLPFKDEWSSELDVVRIVLRELHSGFRYRRDVEAAAFPAVLTHILSRIQSLYKFVIRDANEDCHDDSMLLAYLCEVVVEAAATRTTTSTTVYHQQRATTTVTTTTTAANVAKIKLPSYRQNSLAATSLIDTFAATLTDLSVNVGHWSTDYTVAGCQRLLDLAVACPRLRSFTVDEAADMAQLSETLQRMGTRLQRFQFAPCQCDQCTDSLLPLPADWLAEALGPCTALRQLAFNGQPNPWLLGFVEPSAKPVLARLDSLKINWIYSGTDHIRASLVQLVQMLPASCRLSVRYWPYWWTLAWNAHMSWTDQVAFWIRLSRDGQRSVSLKMVYSQQTALTEYDQLRAALQNGGTLKLQFPAIDMAERTAHEQQMAELILKHEKCTIHVGDRDCFPKLMKLD